MNRFVLILMLCFVISGIACAQARFYEGFIINNNQDTVKGLVEYKGNQTSTEVCVFKNNEQSNPVSYFPFEIKGYRYGENKFFVSKSIYRDGQKQNMFLEYLVDGIVDVYCYYENNNPHYLIQTENDSLIELKTVKKVIGAAEAKELQNRSAYDRDRPDKYIYESKTYIYVLKDIFKASPKVSAKANQAALSHGSLINLASSYHHEICPDQECKIYKKGSDGHIKAGVLLGIGYLSLGKSSSTDVNYYYLGSLDMVSDYYPYLGFFILTGLPGINANMHFQFEGTVNHVNMEVSGYSNINGMIFYNEIKFSQTTFNANAILKYAIGAKKLKPVLQFGGFVNYGMGESFSKKGSGTPYTRVSPFSALDFGIAGGTGLMFETAKKKTIILDLRYRMGFNFTDVAKANYYSLGIGYQL